MHQPHSHLPTARRRRALVLTLAAWVLASAGLLRADVETLETLPGFQVDLVLKAEKDKHGSWISLGKDNKGRLLLGGQRGQPLTRLTMKDGKIEKEEVLKLPVSEIMGSLWAFDTLYVNASDGKRFGLFRLTESASGAWDAELLREWTGGAGEHGAHGIVLAPDGKSLLTVCGNFVNVPNDILPTSPHRNYSDDLVLPRAEDGNGFGAGRKPPGGFVVRLDKDGKNPELFASGQRNTYDIAVNADGEVFGFDSDMEWDWGTAWYRPTRAYHIVSGGDTGFREGTGKWPTYYPDSLPEIVNIGVGSPTGVMFGTGAKFPAKYQRAFFMLDWTYGRVIAVHLMPTGAGYTGVWENLVAPKHIKDKNAGKNPNNVTDVVIGEDGALYFTTGGRGTQGNLYRVTYTGKESTAPASADPAGAEARALRHQLEQYHREPNPKAIEAAWKHLGSEDRSIRYAARIAVERQPVAEWKAKALAESNPQAALTALLALARYGEKNSQPEILSALSKLPIDKLSETQQLEKIRVIEVTIARHGKPEGPAAKELVAELSPLLPAKSWPLNRELSQTLLSLEAPDAVAKTVKLMTETKAEEEQVGYALSLRQIAFGWTPELRKQYFSWFLQDRSALSHTGDTVKWFEDAGRGFAEGSSFNKFIANIHAEAQKTLGPQEVLALADVLKAYTPPGAKPAAKPKKEHKFVKNWEMKDLEPLVKEPLKGRNYNRGVEALAAAQCLACHKFGSEGGSVGPDITAVAARFTQRDVLESIIEPSKVISEQYQNIDLRTKDGDVIVGRIVEEKPDALVLMPNQLKPDEKVTVKKADIKSRGPSKLSPMPEGLVSILSKDEVLDLVALLISGGNKSHPAFSKQ